MLKSRKSQLTCSYCSRIFKDPIIFPCGDSICREHLSQREAIKDNKIKCKKCNEEFQVKDNQIKSNEALKKLVEDQTHLSDEEINLKLDLEESKTSRKSINNEFTQNRTQIELDVFEHFRYCFGNDRKNKEIRSNVFENSKREIFFVRS